MIPVLLVAGAIAGAGQVESDLRPPAPAMKTEIAALRPAPPPAPPAGPVVVDPRGVIPNVRDRIRNLEALTADFTQVNHYQAAALSDTFSGRLFARMPDDFLLRYTDPAGQFLLSDGATVSMYVPENEQVVRGHISRAGEELNFFTLILDYLGRSDATVESAQGAYEIALRPGAGGAVREMSLTVDAVTYLPSRISIVDENLNRSAYALADVTTGTPLADSVFQPTVPEGVEVIDP